MKMSISSKNSSYGSGSDRVDYVRNSDDNSDLPEAIHLIASSSYNAYLLETYKEGDLIGPATSHIQNSLNERMREDLSPFLVAEKQPTDLKLSLFPTSLSGAMWLQFARSVEKRSDFKVCPQCGDWFEVVRKGKEFCSNRCRTRAHRSRTAET